MPASRVTSKSPWHIILVLDDSSSMAGQPSSDVNEALKEFIDALVTASMGQKPYFKVSIVSFGTGYKTLCEAVPETAVDEKKVAILTGSSGSTNLAAALDEVERILKKWPGAESDFEPFVFILSDGNPDDAGLAVKAAERIKTLTIAAGKPRIVTLGFGTVDDALMRQLASNGELYKKMASSKDIIQLLPAIGTIGTMPGGAQDVEDAIMKL